MSNWKAVTRREPCRICRKDHWCIRDLESGVEICMRVANNRPKTFRSGDVGYVYADGAKPTYTATRPVREEPRIEIDCKKILSVWKCSPERHSPAHLAKSLGLPMSSVLAYDPVYAVGRDAWAFPMRNGQGAIVGIRLRNDAGRKWAVTGSRQGLFIPRCQPSDTIIVCEGPTSAAAGFSLGFFTIGLPSAGSGGVELFRYILNHSPRISRVVVIADNKVKPDGAEDVGIKAAERIAGSLSGVSTCVMILPAKDLRDFARHGGDAGLLNNLIEGSVWNYGKLDIRSAETA